MNEPEPIVPRDEAEREARYCRHAWQDGRNKGRRDGTIVGLFLGLFLGLLFAMAAAVARLP